jgi:maltose-binding protein MalE
LITAIDKIILGEATPKEALDEAVETINAAIN